MERQVVITRLERGKKKKNNNDHFTVEVLKKMYLKLNIRYLYF